MLIWQKYQNFKRIFVLSFCLNVFCIAVGGVLSLSYWSENESLSTNLVIAVDDNRRLLDIETAFFDLKAMNSVRESSSTRFADSVKVKKWQLLERIKVLSVQLSDTSFYKVIHNWEEKASMGLDSLIQDYLKFKKNMQAKNLEKMAEISKKLNQTKKNLAMISVLTLIFGILLPIYLVSKATKFLLKIKSDSEEFISHLTKEWVVQSSYYEGDAFKNLEFWLKMILISAEKLGPLSGLPVLDYTADISHIVRTEIEKQKAA